MHNGLQKKLLTKIIAAGMAALCMTNMMVLTPEKFSQTGTSIVALAYSTGNYRVNSTSGINVRSGAGTGYRIIGAAINKTAFTVDRISGNWGHTNSIKCTNGYQSGWVSLTYCSPMKSEFESGTYMVTASSGLNVRKGAGTNYSIKTAVRYGTYLEITSKSGDWGYSPTVGGYVNMNYTVLVKTPTPTPVTPLSTSTIYYITPACATDNVLDVYEGKTANGTNVLSYAKHGGNNQKFKAVYVSNGYYAFYNVSSGKVLDVSGGVAVNGANVQIYQYNGTASQLWCLYEAGNGYYYIQSKLNSSYYLDVNGASSANHANVQLYYGNSSSAQKFRFTAISNNVRALGINSYSSEYRNSKYYASVLNTSRTGANRTSVVNIAASQVGYHEGSYAGTTSGSNNKCEYNRWYYNSSYAYGENYPWCAVFVNWCMRQAGVSYNVFPGDYNKSGIYAEGVSQVKAWFNNRARYYSSYSYTPKVGDVVIFTYSHIGIVAGVSGTGRSARVTVIEGNCSNGVQRNIYTNYGSSLAGYCVPNY